MAKPLSMEDNYAYKAAHFLLNGRFRFRRLKEARQLAEFLSQACPNPRIAIVGITEILVNAIEHGNLGLSAEEKSNLQFQDNWLQEIDRRLDSPEHIHQYVEVEFIRTDAEIQIKVTDQGQGFNWKQGEEDNSLATHGRGILLAKKLAFKRLEYSKKGNEVTCIISLK